MTKPPRSAFALQTILDRTHAEAHVRFAREHLLSAARAENDAERGLAPFEREVLVAEIRDYRLTMAVMHLLQAFARPAEVAS